MLAEAGVTIIVNTQIRVLLKFAIRLIVNFLMSNYTQAN